MNFEWIKHNVKKLFFCLLFFINIFLAYAENIKTNELKYIFSLDTSFTTTALKNLGYGIGVNYEHKLTDFLSYIIIIFIFL
jgi:hypothetical protein